MSSNPCSAPQRCHCLLCLLLCPAGTSLCCALHRSQWVLNPLLRSVWVPLSSWSLAVSYMSPIASLSPCCDPYRSHHTLHPLLYPVSAPEHPCPLAACWTGPTAPPPPYCTLCVPHSTHRPLSVPQTDPTTPLFPLCAPEGSYHTSVPLVCPRWVPPHP